MEISHLSIDTKSLYYNIRNDNATGHTATVATPLKQGASARPELDELKKIPACIHPSSRESLISQILSKSRAQARINNIYVFNKIAVNGQVLENLPSYCIYVREETDRSNFHFGRQKLHYPLSLSYEDLNTYIDNKAVISGISEHLHSYAFIIESFEYWHDSRVLNFNATIVGGNQIPYSKVFVNRRGVGNKFTAIFSDQADNYDMEIIALREKMGFDRVFPGNYDEIISDNFTAACNVVSEYLSKNGAKNIRIMKTEYPYSLYDINYLIDGIKKYAIIQQTATRRKYFNLSVEKLQFVNDFLENVSLFLVTDIKGIPNITEYNISDINSLEKTIASIRFEDRG